MTEHTIPEHPIPEPLLQALVDYLGSRPARETRLLLNGIEAALQPRGPAEAPLPTIDPPPPAA